MPSVIASLQMSGAGKQWWISFKKFKKKLYATKRPYNKPKKQKRAVG